MTTRTGKRISRAPAAPRHRYAAAATLLLLALASRAGAQKAALVEVTRPSTDAVREELPLTGTVTSERRAALSPRVSGLVATVAVDAGDRVAAGDVLLQLDDAMAKLAVESARAAHEEARVRLAEAERLRDEALELLKKNTLASTEAESRQAEARIAAAAAKRLEATLRERQEELERHHLLAPFAGVIGRKLTEAGEWVETGTPVLELVDADDVRLDVQVPQERFHAIGAGTPVTIRLDARPGDDLPGRVAAKVPVTDPSARTFLVRVVPEGVHQAMRPGMSGSAVFRLGGGSDAMLVPRDAVVRNADGTATVWIVEQDEAGARAASRRVHLGRSYSDVVEVHEGLAADVAIVVRGNERLQEGQAVRIVGPGPREAAAEAPAGQGS